MPINSEIANLIIVTTLENVKHGFLAIVSWIKNLQSDKVQNATKMLPLFNNRQSAIKRRHCSINWSPLVTLHNDNPHSRRQLPVDAYPRSNFFLDAQSNSQETGDEQTPTSGISHSQPHGVAQNGNHCPLNRYPFASVVLNESSGMSACLLVHTLKLSEMLHDSHCR